MLFVFLSQDLQVLRETLNVLNECGFETALVGDLDGIPQERSILIVEDPNRRANGDSSRRRFTFLKYRGFRAVGYVAGAKCDEIWWRDLHCKLSHMIRKKAFETGRINLLVSLEKLKKMVDKSSSSV